MSQEILLNGVSLTELKKTKQAIQKEATKFIADGLKDVAVLIKSIEEAHESEDEEAIEGIEEAAQHAKELLENIRLVSGVSDVTYYLPYSDEGYYDKTPYSRIIEEVEVGGEAVSELYSLLEDMEYTSKTWHKSYC